MAKILTSSHGAFSDVGHCACEQTHIPALKKLFIPLTGNITTKGEREREKKEEAYII